MVFTIFVPSFDSKYQSQQIMLFAFFIFAKIRHVRSDTCLYINRIEQAIGEILQSSKEMVLLNVKQLLESPTFRYLQYNRMQKNDKLN